MTKYSLYIICTLSLCFSQWFDLNYGGLNRTYYVAYPSNSSEPAGLIINMHGFGGTASSQISGTQMNNYAHPENLAVVYPQGVNSSIGSPSWNVGTFWDFNLQELSISNQKESFKLHLEAGAYKMLNSGKWDATSQLLNAQESINKTVKNLPYLNNFK